MNKLNTITKTACFVTGLTMEELKSESRLRHIVDSRRMVFAIAREFLELPYAAIGKYFNQNHATIIHHVKQHKSLMSYDVVYKTRFNTILTLFKKDLGFYDTKELLSEVERLRNENIALNLSLIKNSEQ